ncbi:MAG: aldo/keto reductase [Anaerolineales bacterium]
MMEYRRMGRSGLKISAISLGSWITFGDQIDEAVAAKLTQRAYEAGINFFDNADVYANGESERVMGETMKDFPRESLVISSKVYWPTMPGPNGRGLSRKHIMESCHASLKRMNLEYLDLYFCHRYDPETPLEEVVQAMDDLVRQGKVLYWGTSEWRAGQIARSYAISRELRSYPPVVEQPQYNMFVRRKVEDELVPAAKDFGFGMVTWSPLKFGLLSGKYNKGMPEEKTRLTRDSEWGEKVITEERVELVRRLTVVADEIGATMAQLAIAWLLRIPEVTSVITGASRLEHLDDNLRALEFVEMLTPDILEKIEAILDNAPGEIE